MACHWGPQVSPTCCTAGRACHTNMKPKLTIEYSNWFRLDFGSRICSSKNKDSTISVQAEIQHNLHVWSRTCRMRKGLAP